MPHKGPFDIFEPGLQFVVFRVHCSGSPNHRATTLCWDPSREKTIQKATVANGKCQQIMNNVVKNRGTTEKRDRKMPQKQCINNTYYRAGRSDI